MPARALLFGLVGLLVVLAAVDHLASPVLRARVYEAAAGCAPCGAPCPSTR